jgi:myo-inositol 2-dehydrogenase/D-chiro-inositol 1-dehydrogenase
VAVVKIGIIGAGRIGRIHAENIAHLVPGAQLEGLADIGLNSEMQTWARQLGSRVVSNDPRTLFNDQDIDAVIICSSTDTHADFIIAAAKAGKHIFCEKPIDVDVPSIVAAIEAVSKAGVLLQVGFNRRFDHNFRRIRELVQAGEIGQIHVVKITSRDPAPPPAAYVAVSGGIFLDMMIHDFDMARFQADSEIVEVHAIGAVLVDPEIGKAGDVDTAVVSLKFASGALGMIDNSRKAAYGYDQRVEVFGSKGSASAANDTATTVTLSTEAGITGDKPLYFFLERYKNAFIDEMQAFVESITTKTPTAVGGKDGLENLLVAMAAGKSLREKRPVAIAELKTLYGIG